MSLKSIPRRSRLQLLTILIFDLIFSSAFFSSLFPSTSCKCQQTHQNSTSVIVRASNRPRWNLYTCANTDHQCSWKEILVITSLSVRYLRARECYHVYYITLLCIPDVDIRNYPEKRIFRFWAWQRMYWFHNDVLYFSVKTFSSHKIIGPISYYNTSRD